MERNGAQGSPIINEFSGKIPACISSLPSLEWLGLSNNNFEDLQHARAMFRGRFGSRVGIFLDGSPDTSSKRKRSGTYDLVVTAFHPRHAPLTHSSTSFCVVALSTGKPDARAGRVGDDG